MYRFRWIHIHTRLRSSWEATNPSESEPYFKQFDRLHAIFSEETPLHLCSCHFPNWVKSGRDWARIRSNSKRANEITIRLPVYSNVEGFQVLSGAENRFERHTLSGMFCTGNFTISLNWIRQTQEKLPEFREQGDKFS
jgi:hypothetical protein